MSMVAHAIHLPRVSTLTHATTFTPSLRPRPPSWSVPGISPPTVPASSAPLPGRGAAPLLTSPRSGRSRARLPTGPSSPEPWRARATRLSMRRGWTLAPTTVSANPTSPRKCPDNETHQESGRAPEPEWSTGLFAENGSERSVLCDLSRNIPRAAVRHPVVTRTINYRNVFRCLTAYLTKTWNASN